MTMVSPQMQKSLIIAVVLLILAVLGYRLFTQAPGIVDIASNSSTSVAGQDILSLVEKLESVKIDGDFFASALFSSLRDFSTALNPEAQGRLNPFSLIGADSSQVTRVATSTRQ